MEFDLSFMTLFSALQNGIGISKRLISRIIQIQYYSLVKIHFVDTNLNSAPQIPVILKTTACILENKRSARNMVFNTFVLW